MTRPLTCGHGKLKPGFHKTNMCVCVYFVYYYCENLCSDKVGNLDISKFAFRYAFEMYLK